MKKIGHLMVLVCILLSSPVWAQERVDYGRVWSNWTNVHRFVYLEGFKDGMSEGWNDLERFLHQAFRAVGMDWAEYAPSHTKYYTQSISKNFPDIQELREAMTDFYANPANRYLEFNTVLLAAVAKTRRLSPARIGELLAAAREESRQLHKMRQQEMPTDAEIREYITGPSFSSVIYGEIYGERD